MYDNDTRELDDLKKRESKKENYVGCLGPNYKAG